MEIEANTIKEIYRGHYQLILRSPTPIDLIKIVNPSYNYIWGYKHKESSNIWSVFSDTLYDHKCEEGNLKMRNVELEYLIETKYFLKLLPSINQTLKLIQTNIIPPTYLNINSMSGKGRYDLLKNKVDYLFEIDMPGASDYTPIISPSIIFLQDVLNIFDNVIK